MRDTMIECISLMLLRVQAAFRADEAAEVGLERVKRYLIPRSLTADERQQAERALADIVATCGPVVGGYPSWHPLVAKSLKASDQVTIPSERCGYRGLDHTVYFAHGFVTSPYGNGEEVVRSANNIVGPKNIYVTAEANDAPFYSSGTTPILVKCEWMADLEDGFTSQNLRRAAHAREGSACLAVV